MRKWSVILALSLGVLVGCEDKAREPYGKCVTQEAGGNVIAAAYECEKAVQADPNSTSGRAAAAKLAAMQPALATAKEAKKIADAKAEEERRAKAAAAKAVQDAEDAKCSRWSTICTLGRHPDGSEKTTGLQRFATKAECEGVGVAAGLRCDPCRCLD